MSPFVKLDCKILDKSIWRENPEVCKVWITILAMADSDGLIEASIPGIADRARISIEITEAALEKFQQPDKYSSNPDNDGKRISRVKEGFQILNYGIYREKDYTAVIRQRRHREKLSHRDNVTAYAYASASESKTNKLKNKIKEKIEEFKKIWFEQIKFYMVKYPGLDYNLEREKIEAWIEENPSKSLKKKSWNMFCHNWLGRCRPQYGFKNQQTIKLPETEPEWLFDKISKIRYLNPNFKNPSEG